MVDAANPGRDTYGLSRVVIEIVVAVRRLFYYQNKTCDLYNYPARAVYLGGR